MITIHCTREASPLWMRRVDLLQSVTVPAAPSMVPTTTPAASFIDIILPKLAGRVRGCAVRVPTASVSAVDYTCQLASKTDVSALIVYLKTARPGILGMTDKPLVSSDLRSRPESLVIAAPQVQVMGQWMLRIFGWYGNEWGFSARIFDVTQKIP